MPTDYTAKVRGIDPSIIAHWTLGESAGLTAVDQINRPAQNGAYTGGLLGQPGIGDGKTSLLTDGANDVVNIYTPAFRDAFNNAEGTAMIWARVNDIGVWTDGAGRYPLYLAADGNNAVWVPRRTPANGVLQSNYRAGGVSKIQSNADFNNTLTWMLLAITWSVDDDEVIHYVNGAQWGATDNGLGAWVGNLNPNSTVIGATGLGPANVWHGWLQHPAVWGAPLTPAQIADLFIVP